MKFKKYFKIKYKKNNVYQYDKLYNGSIGLKALGTCQLTNNQVTTTIKILKRSIKKKNFLINNVNPSTGVTRKPRDIRMGRGKGNFAFNIFHLKAGKIMFELKGISEKLSLRAFALCANRLPIKTIIVKKKMINVQTILRVTDNSGAIFVKCVKLPKNKSTTIGQILTGVVQKSIIKKNIKKSKEIKKGQICTCVIVRDKTNLRRWGGFFIRASTNAVVLLNKYYLPIASRILGPVFRELRLNIKFNKIISISQISF